MRLPAIQEPERYVGLYVYDFGTHVAIGYTAAEVGHLRSSELHRQGMAYQIYRVDEAGVLELRGVLDARLAGMEAVCFLRANPSMARRDFDTITATAAECPLPCAAELHVASLDAFHPPHVTAITYGASATDAISGWLIKHGGRLGDQVVAGLDVFMEFAGSTGERIESCHLPALLDYSDRPAQEVLQAVHQPIQR